MDSTMKDYMEKITSSMDEFHLELRNNTAAVRAITVNFDDLLSWRPDLERRVADLGVAVSDLQQGHVSAAVAPDARHCPSKRDELYSFQIP
ncbi:hypothetical protein D1007_00128 [Hordeum vulgare]|nr:hypothetical protein D1007_00128 [Hordeum vulgare]